MNRNRFNQPVSAASQAIVAAIVLGGTFALSAARADEEPTPVDKPTSEAVQVVEAQDVVEDLSRPVEVYPVTVDEPAPVEPTAEPTPEPEVFAPMPVAEPEVEVSSIGPFYTLEPCAADEIPAGFVPNCYWDASERGNGVGYDFIWWEGEVFYPEFGR